MQKIYSGEILNVSSFNQGLILAVKEKANDGRTVLRFYGYDAVNKIFSRIKRNTYLKIKFGYESEQIAQILGDYISCDSAFLSGGNVMTIFPTGSYSIFDQNGVETISSQLSYRDHPACDIVSDDDAVWSAVPQDNSVIKYSPNDGRILLRFGGGEDTRLNYPNAVFLLGSTLYICNRSSQKIMTLNTDTLQLKDYRIFAERVIKYMNVQSLEFAWLQSGLYILD